MFKKLLLLFVFAISSSAYAMPETYNVQSETTKLEWMGSKKIGDDKHMGTVNLKTGKIQMQDGKPVSGEFVIDMTSINSTDLKDPKYKAKLDGHLKNADFFDVDNHPTSQFSFSKVKDLGNGQFELVGEMTIRGVTKPKTIQAQITTTEGKLSAITNIEIDRTKYGVMYKADTANKDWFFVKWFKGGADKIINNNINLKVDLVASKK